MTAVSSSAFEKAFFPLLLLLFLLLPLPRLHLHLPLHLLLMSMMSILSIMSMSMSERSVQKRVVIAGQKRVVEVVVQSRQMLKRS